jgi:cysteine-rich repeat protein
LQKLAELKRNEQPNSQSCLKYEEDAFRSLKACYDENHPALCSSFQYNAPTSDDMKDLTKIIDSFSVNDYYRPLVTEELTDLITKCGSTDDATPFDLSYPPVRVFFCAVVNEQDADIDTSMLEHAMSSSLGGGDVSLASEKLFASKCGDISPPSAYVGSRTDFRLVQWLPQRATDVDNLRSYYTAPITDSYKEVIFFKYDDYETQCGNGLREAGESCDLFGDNGSSEGGCSDMCQVIPNYECTTGQLERSYCYRTQCGDGIKSLDEECDDNNTLSNDGCSNKCTVETDYHCTTNYNETSLCQQRLLLIAPSSTHLISDVSSSSAPLSSQSVPIRTNEPSQPLQVSSSNSLVYRLHWVTVLLSVVISCWLLIR